MRVPNFHTAPKGHLFEIRINSQDVLEGLDSTKFLENFEEQKNT